MFSHHDLKTATDAEYATYINTQPRECLLYAADRATVAQVASAGAKYPREALVHATDKLVQTPEAFNLAVYKQPTAALIYALNYLTSDQVVYASDTAPSTAVAYAAGRLPKDRLWIYVQTAPEMAVRHIMDILVSTDVQPLNATLETTRMVNGYSTWTPMLNQPNPHSLPQKTMLDEIIIYALASPISTLAHMILLYAPESYYTSEQKTLLEGKENQTKFPYL